MLNLFHQLDDFLWICDGVLSESECSLLKSHALSSLERSETLDNHKNLDQDIRTSSDTALHKINYNTQQEIYHAIDKIENIVKATSCLPVSNQEPLGIVKYSAGEEYKNHHDWFKQENSDYDIQIKKGGQRLCTMLFCLNDLQGGGGETSFPLWGEVKVEPRVGRAIYWLNYVDGKPVRESLHAGLPPESGTKWMAVKWVRESCYKKY
jgi:prolyl 4-hydroxylase